jgi:hypothetical protein
MPWQKFWKELWRTQKSFKSLRRASARTATQFDLGSVLRLAILDIFGRILKIDVARSAPKNIQRSREGENG